MSLQTKLPIAEWDRIRSKHQFAEPKTLHPPLRVLRWLQYKLQLKKNGGGGTSAMRSQAQMDGTQTTHFYTFCPLRPIPSFNHERGFRCPWRVGNVYYELVSSDHTEIDCPWCLNGLRWGEP